MSSSSSKSGPYAFEGIKPSEAGSSSSGGDGSGGKRHKKSRSRSPPRPKAPTNGGDVVWQKMVRHSSPQKKRGGGSVLHVSLAWDELFTEDDRKSRLRCVR